MSDTAFYVYISGMLMYGNGRHMHDVCYYPAHAQGVKGVLPGFAPLPVN